MPMAWQIDRGGRQRTPLIVDSGYIVETQGFRICRRGDSQTLLFYAAFQVFFDFPQYPDTLRYRTMHTVRTNRIIL
jgi:hypothetical protein